MARTVIAADFGGTNLRAAIVQEGGELLERREIRTPEDATSERILDRIAELLLSLLSPSGFKPVATCLAVPGLIDADQGMVLAAPNIPAFRNLLLTAPIQQRLGLPTFIENDASAAGLGEFRFGAGRGTRHLLHATLGTGIGGGIVVDRRLYRGAKGLAGEIGHIVIDPSGPVCTCGSRGCLEALVSGRAFGERAARLIESGRAPVLADLVGEREPNATDLFSAAQHGEQVAEAEIRHGGHILGLGLGSLANVLNPDAITLSGGLLNMGEMLLGPARQSMHSIAYGSASSTLVRLSELGDDAGLLGAAAVAFERMD